MKQSTQQFYVGGVWNIANAPLATVNFQCKLMGAVAYDVTYDCVAPSEPAQNPGLGDYGNCVKPVGYVGENWTADFGFDVPGIAPPFDYDVTVKFIADDGETVLFEVETIFKIK